MHQWTLALPLFTSRHERFWALCCWCCGGIWSGGEAFETEYEPRIKENAESLLVDRILVVREAASAYIQLRDSQKASEADHAGLSHNPRTAPQYDTHSPTVLRKYVSHILLVYVGAVWSRILYIIVLQLALPTCMCIETDGSKITFIHL